MALTQTDESLQVMNQEFETMKQLMAQVPQPAPANAKTYSHYYKRLPRGSTHVDIYRVIQLFNVPAGPLDHAVKKLLCAGGRGRTAKSYKQDLIEARDSICRALEMLEEDERDQEEST